MRTLSEYIGYCAPSALPLPPNYTMPANWPRTHYTAQVGLFPLCPISAPPHTHTPFAGIISMNHNTWLERVVHFLEALPVDKDLECMSQIEFSLLVAFSIQCLARLLTLVHSSPYNPAGLDQNPASTLLWVLSWHNNSPS